MDIQGLAPAAPAQTTQTAAPAAPDAAAAAPAAASPPAANRPDWLPETHWDPEKAQIKDTFGQHFAELSTAHQAEADRLAKLPKSADEYKFAAPEGLDLPQGVDLALDDSNPALKAFRQYAFENKIDPERAQGLVNLYVGEQARQHKLIAERIDAEKKKLGPNWEQRVSALNTALTGHIGAQFANALVGPTSLWTAEQVQGFEALVRKVTTQGAAPVNGAPSQPPAAPPPSLNERLFPKSAAQAKAG